MVLPFIRHAVSRSRRVALDHYLLFTIYHSPADEDSFRQTRKHRRHRTHVARSGGCASRVAARGNRVGRGAARGGNFEGQPASGNPHRSGHEGAEALADVWGDAAGNAPAVASVTRLALRPCRRFPGTTQGRRARRSEEHTSELQSRFDLVCRLLLEKKKKKTEKDT